MKSVILYIVIQCMEPSIILSFIFTLKKAHDLIWMYHFNYYKISADFSWVDRYDKVVFASGSNIYIDTYYPYRVYIN